MTSLLRDLRQLVRVLLRRPGVPLLMILTLAVGIGANTAIFNMVNALVLRPLPFHDPAPLVALHETPRSRGSEWDPISAPNLRDWRRGLDVFAGLGAFGGTNYNLGLEGRPEWVEAARVESSLFPPIGVSPIVGRGFTADEDRPDGAPVVLLSHALWQRLFLGDRGVVGRTLRLDGEVHEIVGVMPERFGFPESAKLWTPLGLDPDGRARDDRFLNALARLAPGVDAAGAQAALEKIRAPLLLHFAELDERVNAGWPAYEKALQDAGKEYTAHVYAGANHGFHNDTTPRYDEAAAKLAWSPTVEFPARHLKAD